MELMNYTKAIEELVSIKKKLGQCSYNEEKAIETAIWIIEQMRDVQLFGSSIVLDEEMYKVYLRDAEFQKHTNECLAQIISRSIVSWLDIKRDFPSKHQVELTAEFCAIAPLSHILMEIKEKEKDKNENC